MTNRFFFLNFRALWGRRRLAAGENSRKKKNVRSSCSVKIDRYREIKMYGKRVRESRHGEAKGEAVERPLAARER